MELYFVFPHTSLLRVTYVAGGTSVMRLILDISEGSDFFMFKNFENEGTTIHRKFETLPSGRALHPRTLGTTEISLREHAVL